MKRRFFIAFSIALPIFSRAQPVAALVMLEALVKVLSDAGEALEKFTNGIVTAVTAGAKGFDYVSMKRARSRLIDLSSRMTFLINQKQRVIVENIDEYVALASEKGVKPEILSEAWNEVTYRIRLTLIDVKLLLEDVSIERSAFVSSDAYSLLMGSLVSRSTILSRLDEISPPVKNDEIRTLRQASLKYKKILMEARLALKELNKFINRENEIREK